MAIRNPSPSLEVTVVTLAEPTGIVPGCAFVPDDACVAGALLVLFSFGARHSRAQCPSKAHHNDTSSFIHTASIAGHYKTSSAMDTTEFESSKLGNRSQYVCPITNIHIPQLGTTFTKGRSRTLRRPGMRERPGQLISPIFFFHTLFQTRGEIFNDTHHRRWWLKIAGLAKSAPRRWSTGHWSTSPPPPTPESSRSGAGTGRCSSRSARRGTPLRT
jgi:hypothetical protein